MRETRERQRRMEGAIGRLLRYGVIVAAALLLVGVILFLFANGGRAAAFGVFVRRPFAWDQVPVWAARVLSGGHESVLWFGLLGLILLPVLRVALSTMLFLRERDWLYVGFTLAVLAVLIFSLAGGRFF